jgi:hypothetical protein
VVKSPAFRQDFQRDFLTSWGVSRIVTVIHQRSVLAVLGWLVCTCLLVSPSSALGAEADFADLPDESFVLVDGRKFQGRYNEQLGRLWIAGLGNAIIRVTPPEIAKRSPIVKPPPHVIPPPAVPSESVDQIAANNREQVVLQAVPGSVKAVHYGDNPDDILKLTFLRNQLAEHEKKAFYFNKIFDKEQDNIRDLMVSVKKSLENYKRAKDYYELRGAAALGYENNATFNLREAIRVMGNIKAELEAAQVKAAEYAERKQDAVNSILAAGREINSLESRLASARQQNDVDLLGQ